MKIEKIHVVINPASGQDKPILAILNRTFAERNLTWTVSVTQKEGDAKAQTHKALSDGADVIAVCGGDGTVTAVADALLGCKTPLAVLPAGTANVFAQELGISVNLGQAALLACGDDAVIRAVDVGQINGKPFLLRVGVGFEANMVAKADRKLKDQLGFLAYVWSAAQNVVDLQPATYHLTLDGKEVTIDAITCGIINSGQLGVGVNISNLVSVDDGLLDVIAVRQADLPTAAQIMGSVMGISPSAPELSDSDSSSFLHWQAKNISLTTEPLQAVQFDGEMLETGIIECSVLPQALRVLVPQ